MDEAEKKVLGSGGAGVMRVGGAEASVVGARVAGQRIAPEIWVEAERAYMDGATGAEVGARFGMAAQTVYVHMAGRGKRAERLRAKLERKLAMEAAGGKAPAPSAADVAVMLARELSEVGERLIAASGLRDRMHDREDGVAVKRRRYGPEVWAAARRDYEVGGYTAGRVAERYGMAEDTVSCRAWREGWRKTVNEPPAPLLPYPDPAQVEEDGASAWPRVAHEAQRAPEGAWSTWLFQGGRGAGKTRAGAEWLAERALATPNGRFALVGPTQHDVREVMIDGPSGLRSLAGRERPSYESSRRKLTWKNGAVAYAFSAEEPERLRGPQFMAAWADEFCTWPKPDHTMAMLRMGLRLGGDPRLVVTTTPKPIASLRRLRDEVSCVVTQAASVVNAANLSPSFLSGLEAIYGGTRLARQELEGVLVPGDGALWRRGEIEAARGARPARFDRVVVGVDPPAGAEGSACGIVAAGRLGKQGFVLEDASVAGLSPQGWAMRVVETAEKHGATRIIAEANQGGDMVRATLAAAGAKCRIELVHARHAKRARAEPIAALYEQGKVTHCGAFPQLEEEMMALGGAEETAGQARLDRADALVWALTALLVEKQPLRPGIILL